MIKVGFGLPQILLKLLQLGGQRLLFCPDGFPLLLQLGVAGRQILMLQIQGIPRFAKSLRHWVCSSVRVWS